MEPLIQPGRLGPFRAAAQLYGLADELGRDPAGTLAALAAMGEWLVLEFHPHLPDPLDMARRCLDGLRAVLADAALPPAGRAAGPARRGPAIPAPPTHPETP